MSNDYFVRNKKRILGSIIFIILLQIISVNAIRPEDLSENGLPEEEIDYSKLAMEDPQAFAQLINQNPQLIRQALNANNLNLEAFKNPIPEKLVLHLPEYSEKLSGSQLGQMQDQEAIAEALDTVSDAEKLKEIPDTKLITLTTEQIQRIESKEGIDRLLASGHDAKAAVLKKLSAKQLETVAAELSFSHTTYMTSAQARDLSAAVQAEIMNNPHSMLQGRRPNEFEREILLENYGYIGGKQFFTEAILSDPNIKLRQLAEGSFGKPDASFIVNDLFVRGEVRAGVGAVVPTSQGIQVGASLLVDTLSATNPHAGQKDRHDFIVSAYGVTIGLEGEEDFSDGYGTMQDTLTGLSVTSGESGYFVGSAGGCSVASKCVTLTQNSFSQSGSADLDVTDVSNPFTSAKFSPTAKGTISNGNNEFKVEFGEVSIPPNTESFAQSITDGRGNIHEYDTKTGRYSSSVSTCSALTGRAVFDITGAAEGCDPKIVGSCEAGEKDAASKESTEEDLLDKMNRYFNIINRASKDSGRLEDGPYVTLGTRG
jgi:hypothetical protein